MPQSVFTLVEAKKSNLITVGRITGVFGIKGWVKLKSFTDPQDNVLEYSPLLLKTKHGVKECEIAEYQFRPQGLVVRLKGVDDRNAAEALAPVDVAIDKSLLPELGDDDFYWHQLEGLRVVTIFDGNAQDLGVVSKVMATGANDVLEVKPDAQSIDDRDRLVPYVLDLYVKKVDLSAECITVDWDPEF